MRAHAAQHTAHDRMIGSELWILAMGTIVLGFGAVLLLVWDPRALLLALGVGMMAVGTRMAFSRVKAREHVESEASSMYLEYLQFLGFETAEASNGREALERALARLPAVILMDLAMPVMDGWEATRRLKADRRTKHIPVIAVTGHALEGDAERARQAGCDGVRSKPAFPRIS